MKPKKPFMIEGGPTANEFLRITPTGRVKWVDWDGSQYSTKEDAQKALDGVNLLHPARIIEILDYVRVRS